MRLEIAYIRSKIGLFRSRLIYDYKPFNRKKMIRFYSNFIKPGDLCFDIGAHTGNRTGAWLSIGGYVVAVEPQPACIDLLEKKFSKDDRFFLLKNAVGKVPGKAILYISTLNPTVSTLSKEWIDVLRNFESSSLWDENVEIDMIMLDTIIEIFGCPEFCKIDVEGYEVEALEGLSVPIKALSFEFFPTTPWQTEKCIGRLEALGTYSYNWSLTESFRLKETNWLPADEMLRTIQGYAGRKSGDVYARLQP